MTCSPKRIRSSLRRAGSSCLPADSGLRHCQELSAAHGGKPEVSAARAGSALHWHGGPVLREAKALVPSGWTCVHRAAGAFASMISFGPLPFARPWYVASGNILVRRLSPNNRKIDVEDRHDARALLHPALLWAMGGDWPPFTLACATAAMP